MYTYLRLYVYTVYVYRYVYTQKADTVTLNASLFSDYDTRINRAVQKNSDKKQKVKGASLMYSKDLRQTLERVNLLLTLKLPEDI